MRKKFLVIYEKADRNWSAYFLQVGGCAVTGRTLESTRNQAREALEFHFEGLLETGSELPEPTPIDVDALFQQFPFDFAGFIEIETERHAAVA